IVFGQAYPPWLAGVPLLRRRSKCGLNWSSHDFAQNEPAFGPSARLLSIEPELALTSAQRFYQPLRCVATEPVGSRIDKGRKNGSRRGIYFPGEEFQQIGLRHLPFHFHRRSYGGQIRRQN